MASGPLQLVSGEWLVSRRNNAVHQQRTLQRLKWQWQPLPGALASGLGRNVTARPARRATALTVSLDSSSASHACSAGAIHARADDDDGGAAAAAAVVVVGTAAVVMVVVVGIAAVVGGNSGASSCSSGASSICGGTNGHRFHWPYQVHMQIQIDQALLPHELAAP